MTEIRNCCDGADRKPYKFKIFLPEEQVIDEAWASGAGERDAANGIPRIYKGAVKAIGIISGAEYNFT